MENDIENCYGKECVACRKKCDFKTLGESVISEKREVYSARRDSSRSEWSVDALEDVSALKAFFPDESEAGGDKQNSGKALAAEALRRIYFMLKEHPKTTIDLLKMTFEGATQSDISRQTGVTRQAVSKRLKGDIGGIAELLGMKNFDKPIPESKLLGLTGKEFEVYKLLFIDGCTERSAAIQLGIPKSTIHRMGQNLRKKLAKSGARKRPSNKKS